MLSAKIPCLWTGTTYKLYVDDADLASYLEAFEVTTGETLPADTATLYQLDADSGLYQIQFVDQDGVLGWDDETTYVGNYDASGNASTSGGYDANGNEQAGGTFTFYDGYTVEFSVGDIVLGSSVAEVSSSGASLELSPIEIATSTDDTENSNEVTNIIRLLQTMDDDGDPTNGITVAEAVRTAAIGQAMDMTVDINSFDDEATNFIAAADLPVMVTIETAWTHFFDVYQDHQQADVIEGGISLDELIGPEFLMGRHILVNSGDQR